MKTKQRILNLKTKADALKLYRELKHKTRGDAPRDFTEWAGYSRQAYYTWPDELPENLRFQLVGRLLTLMEKRGVKSD